MFQSKHPPEQTGVQQLCHWSAHRQHWQSRHVQTGPTLQDGNLHIQGVGQRDQPAAPVAAGLRHSRPVSLPRGWAAALANRDGCRCAGLRLFHGSPMLAGGYKWARGCYECTFPVTNSGACPGVPHLSCTHSTRPLPSAPVTSRASGALASGQPRRWQRCCGERCADVLVAGFLNWKQKLQRLFHCLFFVLAKISALVAWAG